MHSQKCVSDSHSHAQNLICPVCGKELYRVNGSFQCSERHTFDITREKYVNLLPNGYGNSNIHGDNPVMLQARRRFLESGYYEALSDAINSFAITHFYKTDPGRSFTTVDLGCGEGYYTGRLIECLAEFNGRSSMQSFGLDISKEAVRMSAKKYNGSFFFVNDIKYRICLEDSSADVLLNIFAPRNPDEFARITRNDGILIVAIPGDRHLMEIRNIVDMPGMEPDKHDKIFGQLGSYFRLVHEETLEYEADLSRGDVTDLILMVPGFPEVKGKLTSGEIETGECQTTFSFQIMVFSKES
jgi:23S rRNA (guanine745-N1)-methyltransferase